MTREMVDEILAQARAAVEARAALAKTPRQRLAFILGAEAHRIDCGGCDGEGLFVFHTPVSTPDGYGGRIDSEPRLYTATGALHVCRASHEVASCRAPFRRHWFTVIRAGASYVSPSCLRCGAKRPAIVLE